MPQTPNFKLPYPNLSDPPNGAQQIEDLASATDEAIQDGYENLRPIAGQKFLSQVLTPPATNTWSTWDAALQLANPGRPCVILGFASGYMLNDSAGTLGRLRVSISLDGGVTWTEGTQVTDQAGVVGGSGAATRRGGFTAFHTRQGTPSGQIHVRAEILWSDGGLGADPDFYDGAVMALVLPFG